MEWIVVAILVLAITAGVGLVLLRLHGNMRKEPPVFHPRGKLLSDTEQSFLQTLEDALQGQYRIATKVSLREVIEPRRSLSPNQRRSAFVKMGRTSLDFVLCDNQTYEVLAAIRLDNQRRSGASGGSGEDVFVENALHSANIHLIRIEPHAVLSKAHLAAQIESVFAKDLIDTLTLAPSIATRLRLSLREGCNL